jgi:hypothetical protein
MSQFPARLHVLLASYAPIGIVIRRGPSKYVATLLWNRNRDEFQLGQWLKGRIYERRSDLSPDGKHLIYFAMNGKWESETKGAWTAISRAPYLKAIALFAKGDCWHGGGLWTQKSSYWLNDGYGHKILQDTSSVCRDANYCPTENYGAECLSVYYHRLQRDGWQWVERIKVGGPWKLEKDIFEKPIAQGWILRKIAHAQVGPPEGKGCYWDEHELVSPDAKTIIACPTWEWADLDVNRLVWAAEGKLFSGQIQKSGLTREVELYDFNEMKFSAIKAPY